MIDQRPVLVLLLEFQHATIRRASNRHYHLLLGGIIKAKDNRGDPRAFDCPKSKPFHGLVQQCDW